MFVVAITAPSSIVLVFKTKMYHEKKGNLPTPPPFTRKNQQKLYIYERKWGTPSAKGCGYGEENPGKGIMVGHAGLFEHTCIGGYTRA